MLRPVCSCMRHSFDRVSGDCHIPRLISEPTERGGSSPRCTSSPCTRGGVKVIRVRHSGCGDWRGLVWRREPSGEGRIGVVRTLRGGDRRRLSSRPSVRLLRPARLAVQRGWGPRGGAGLVTSPSEQSGHAMHKRLSCVKTRSARRGRATGCARGQGRLWWREPLSAVPCAARHIAVAQRVAQPGI